MLNIFMFTNNTMLRVQVHLISFNINNIVHVHIGRDVLCMKCKNIYALIIL